MLSGEGSAPTKIRARRGRNLAGLSRYTKTSLHTAHKSRPVIRAALLLAPWPTVMKCAAAGGPVLCCHSNYEGYTALPFDPIYDTILWQARLPLRHCCPHLWSPHFGSPRNVGYEMNAKDFVNRVMNSHSDFLQEFLDILEENQLPFCVIGGLAVNAYAEPVVSLDLIVISERLDELLAILENRFIVKRHPHSINVSTPHSDLRIQIQTDARYQAFITRSSHKIVLGYHIPVAALEDVFQGKVWAFSDSTPRPSKRQKDWADIMRLAETHPHLVSLLPNSLRNRFMTEQEEH